MKKNEANEFTGKNAEEAIKKGLAECGLTRDTADIKILDEGTSGLFGLMGSKPARVIVVPKAGGVIIQPKDGMTVQAKNRPAPSPAPQPREKHSAPRQQSRPAGPAEKHTYTPSKELETAVTNHLYKMFQLMGFTEEKPELKVTQAQECQADVEFKDSNLSSMLIGKNGKVLRAIEVVLQSMINREFRSKMEYVPKVLVDINKYTLKQKEIIKDNVNEALRTINESGKPFRMAPMSPPLRKYVHMLLQDNPDFETISEGVDEQRRVVIKPRKN